MKVWDSLKIPCAIALILSTSVYTGCNLDDEFDINDELPESYLGNWMDVNENEISVSKQSLTLDGIVYEFKVISKINGTGTPIYGADTYDQNSEADFYFSQPNGTDELRISFTSSLEDYTSYFRVN